METASKCNRGEKFLGFSRIPSTVYKGIFHIASSLTKLLRKGIKFEWDDKCQLSFEHLKKILVEASMLTQPTSGREYAMYSDASKFGLGCVLM